MCYICGKVRTLTIQEATLGFPLEPELVLNVEKRQWYSKKQEPLKNPVVGRMTHLPPQRWPHPNTCRLEYMRLHGRERFKIADRMKGANQLTLRWGDYPGLPAPVVITRVLMSESGRERSMTAWEGLGGFEDGRRCHEPRKEGDLAKLEKAKDQILP